MKNKSLFLPYKIVKNKPYYFVCKRADDQSGDIFVPTGTCEINEPQEVCAFREIKEELGVKHFRNLFNLRIEQTFKTDRNHYFEKAFAFEIADKIKLQKEELSWSEFVPFEEAIKSVKFPFHKEAIQACDKILKNKSYNKIFTVVGPGGSGKDSIIIRAIEKDKRLMKIKTYMTREYKSKDDTKLRIHISKRELDDLEKKGDIIEKNLMVGYWYASSYSQMVNVLASGHDGIINVDINGAKYYQDHFSNIVTIFISAKTEDLIRRLKYRQRDTKEYISKRMQVTKDEIAKSHICDYTIVNEEGKLDESVDKLLGIITENRE